MKRLFMFAAVLMFAVGCSEYDDSALLGRVDELEDRVDGHEQRLAELENKVNNINESYKALTAMFNGGIITSVVSFSEDAGTGYAITILYNDGTSKTFKIYNGVKGDSGEAPAVELKQDDDGRYYWVINGEEPAAERIYADVVTPQLQLDEDGNFQISYDGGKTWKAIGVFSGEVNGGIEMTVEKDESGNVVTVTFTQGDNEWTYSVSESGKSNIAVMLTVDGKDVEPFSTVSIAEGETKTITVAVDGASENAVVTAELQNAGGYTVTVDDMDIMVENVAGGANKLIINILDGGACYHTWVALDASDDVVYTAWIETAEWNEYGYIPAAYGTAFASVKSALEPTVTLHINQAAHKDLVINLSIDPIYGGNVDEFYMNVDASSVTMPSTVTVKKGETSVLVPVSIDRAGMTFDVDYYLNIGIEAEGVEPETDGTEFWFANNFSMPVELTANDLSCEWSHGGPSVSLASLVDGSVESDSYWESYWYVSEGIYTNSDYHIYIDIKLPVAVAAAKFRHYPRNYNVYPASLKYAAVVNGEPQAVGTKTCDNTVDWQETGRLPFPEKTDNVWFGMLESGQGDLGYLEEGYCKCVGLREIEIEIMY